MTSADISETAVHVDTVVYNPDLLTGVDISEAVVHGSDTPVKSFGSVHGSDMTVKSAVETAAVETAAVETAAAENRRRGNRRRGNRHALRLRALRARGQDPVGRGPPRPVARLQCPQWSLPFSKWLGDSLTVASTTPIASRRGTGILTTRSLCPFHLGYVLLAAIALIIRDKTW
jgi:hypothetical protein